MKIAGSKILVTGGAGFIGSHIVDSLVCAGAKVTVLDNLAFGTLDNLAQVKDDIRFVQGDIRDASLLERLAAGMDVVSHQAAQLEIFLATSHPCWDLEVNTLGTLNVLEAARKAGAAKVINASSACVYGQKDGSTTESDTRRPNWTYGVSKLAAEEYGRIYSQSKDLPVVSLRYSIVYGEREWYRRALPIFLRRVIEGQPPVVFGNGGQYRDFIHVADVVALHNRCLVSNAADGQFLNVSTGRGVTVAELAEIISKLFLNGQVIRENISQGQTSTLVPGKRRNTDELKSMILDPTKAEALLGWRPEVGLTEGLRREYDWARANPGRWADIIYSDKGRNS